MLYPKLSQYLESLDLPIAADRQSLWSKLAAQMRSRPEPIVLNFICTHNARRSVLSQSWAHALAHHNGINDLIAYSGGAESTFIHPNSIATLKHIGFQIETVETGPNPLYRLNCGEESQPLSLFSKRFDDPSAEFPYHAILVCSKSDSTCPFIPNAKTRNLIPFEDPGLFDQDDNWLNHYLKASAQIASELQYFFSLL